MRWAAIALALLMAASAYAAKFPPGTCIDRQGLTCGVAPTTWDQANTFWDGPGTWGP